METQVCVSFRTALPIVTVALFAFAVPAYADHMLDINTATLEELDTLPGVGATIAQRIVDGRPYAAVEEISTVQGIGEPGSKTYEDIIPHITVGTSGTNQNQNSGQSNQGAATQEAPVSSGGGVFIEDTKEIRVHIDAASTVFVGADSAFAARVTGAVGVPIENARVVWSFGNGDWREGQSVLYNFAFPGTYVVVADASSGGYSASDRVTITVIPAKVLVSDVTSEYVALTNRSGVEIDIGGWFLFGSGRQFQFPRNTIILDGETVLVSNKRTGLSGTDPGTVVLMYPNGIVAARYEYPLFLGRAQSGSGGAGSSVHAPAEQGNTAELFQSVEREELITAPVVAADASGIFIPPIFGWLAALVGLSGAVSFGVLFVRRMEYQGYTVKELHD